MESHTYAAGRLAWFRERASWRHIGLRYLPLLAGFSLVWEVAQLPLYTLWREAGAGEIVYAVLHCTLGDVAVGGFALFGALTVTQSAAPRTWPGLQVTGITVALGVVYTVFSEWLNTGVRGTWAYSDLMPVVPLIGTGLLPLIQWFVVPALALIFSMRIDRAIPHRSA